MNRWVLIFVALAALASATKSSSEYRSIRKSFFHNVQHEITLFLFCREDRMLLR